MKNWTYCVCVSAIALAGCVSNGDPAGQSLAGADAAKVAAIAPAAGAPMKEATSRTYTDARDAVLAAGNLNAIAPAAGGSIAKKEGTPRVYEDARDHVLTASSLAAIAPAAGGPMKEATPRTFEDARELGQSIDEDEAYLDDAFSE